MGTTHADDPAFLEGVFAAQRATLKSGVRTASGAGKAYQSVAQSAAMAVQDAVDHLRNTMTISTTAYGLAMSQLMEEAPSEGSVSGGKGSKGKKKGKGRDAKAKKPVPSQAQIAIREANGAVRSAAAVLKGIGSDVSHVLSGFPSS